MEVDEEVQGRDKVDDEMEMEKNPTPLVSLALRPTGGGVAVSLQALAGPALRDAVQERMREHGLTKVEVARQAGLRSSSYLGCWLTGVWNGLSAATAAAHNTQISARLRTWLDIPACTPQQRGVSDESVAEPTAAAGASPIAARSTARAAQPSTPPPSSGRRSVGLGLVKVDVCRCISGLCTSGIRHGHLGLHHGRGRPGAAAE